MKIKKRWIALMIVVAGFIIFAIFDSIVGPLSGTSTGKSIGSIALLSSGGSSVPVGISEKAMNEFLHAQNIGDKEGEIEMMMNGSIITPHDGVGVRILDHNAWGMYKVRILDGEGEGLAGYVPGEWIQVRDLSKGKDTSDVKDASKEELDKVHTEVCPPERCGY
ncbi:MAG: hypothetical protein ABSD38_21210 [Syntrophorhabdales bacterium]|jgi:hypothetical protein